MDKPVRNGDRTLEAVTSPRFQEAMYMFDTYRDTTGCFLRLILILV
jgi:hypothetical protein